MGRTGTGAQLALTFNHVAPEQLGDIRVLKITDRFEVERTWQQVERAGHVLAALPVPTVRKITCELLVLGRSQEEVMLNLTRLPRLFAGSQDRPLALRHMPGRYYLARCTEITAPVFTGHSARVNVIFTCRDYRQYSMATGKPVDGADPETDNFTFAGLHVLTDLHCLFVLEAKTGIPGHTPSLYTIPGHPGTVRYQAEVMPEERSVSGTLYLLGEDEDGQLASGMLISAKEAEMRLGRIASHFLLAGRADLIWDTRPDITWETECQSAASFERNGWQNGRLKLELTVQPLGKGPERETVFALTGTGDEEELPLAGLFPNGMGFATPLKLVLSNEGTRALTELSITWPDENGESAFILAGFTLRQGQSMELDREERMVRIDGEPANLYITSGDFPAVQPEETWIRIAATQGTRLSAKISASARWV